MNGTRSTAMPSAFSVFILSVKPGWLSIYILGKFLALRSPAFPSHPVTTSLPTEHSTFHCRYSGSRLPDIASSPLFYPSTSEGSYLCIPLSVASAMPARSLPSLDHFRTTFCCLSFHLRDVTGSLEQKRRLEPSMLRHSVVVLGISLLGQSGARILISVGFK